MQMSGDFKSAATFSPFEFLGQRHRRSAARAMQCHAKDRSSVAGGPEQRCRADGIPSGERAQVRLGQAALGTDRLHGLVAIMPLDRSGLRRNTATSSSGSRLGPRSWCAGLGLALMHEVFREITKLQVDAEPRAVDPFHADLYLLRGSYKVNRDSTSRTPNDRFG
jgi:hypothetical protein